jgi:hypothetical protein
MCIFTHENKECAGVSILYCTLYRPLSREEDKVRLHTMCGVADFLQQPAKKCAKYPLLTACTGFSSRFPRKSSGQRAGQSGERRKRTYTDLFNFLSYNVFIVQILSIGDGKRTAHKM